VRTQKLIGLEKRCGIDVDMKLKLERRFQEKGKGKEKRERKLGRRYEKKGERWRQEHEARCIDIVSYRKHSNPFKYNITQQKHILPFISRKLNKF